MAALAIPLLARVTMHVLLGFMSKYIESSIVSTIIDQTGNQRVDGIHVSMRVIRSPEVDAEG